MSQDHSSLVPKKCILLAACLAPLFLAQAVDVREPEVVTKAAVSADGQYRLSLTSAEQVPSPWDGKVAALNATFRLESKADKTTIFSSQLPGDVFLEKVTLEEVILPSGEDVAGAKGSKWTDSSSLDVTVHHLELGKEQRQLSRMKLVVTLVKATKWESLEFKGIQKADETPLRCGPFELVISEAAPQHLLLAAGAFADHAAQHEAYRQGMPLQFLTHRYATRALQITDAAGQHLTLSMGAFTGGGSTARYAIQGGLPLTLPPKDNSGKTPTALFPPPEDIRYPVVLSLKLPLKYESEQIPFEFQELRLPALRAQP